MRTMRACSSGCAAPPITLSTTKFSSRNKTHIHLFSQFKIFGPLSSLITTVPTTKPFFSLSYKATQKQKQKQWAATSSSSCGANPSNDFIVVNFYRFVFIKEPHEEVAKHLSFIKGLDIHGRIYLNEQGINAQYSGPSKDALAYVEWLKEDIRFSDVLVQISPAFNGHAFPKLKLRYKPSLVQLEGGISHLPLVDPPMRAAPIAPSEWRERLKEVNDSNYVLLDVRNGYEWDIGHFHGAQRPDVDCFRSTSFGESSRVEAIASDPLANVDKEKTDILMYCTGGIRCDVYSTILRKRGFQNLYTLEGGVSHYLKNEGPAEWTGNLFVFDDRLSLPPSAYNPEESTVASSIALGPKNNSFANCYVCGSQVCELRHRNCANIDCNLLFLCCMDCAKDLRGCCCPQCTTAPRLRPVLPGNQRYKKWYIYREMEVQSMLTSISPTSEEGIYFTSTTLKPPSLQMTGTLLPLYSNCIIQTTASTRDL